MDQKCLGHQEGDLATFQHSTLCLGDVIIIIVIISIIVIIIIIVIIFIIIVIIIVITCSLFSGGWRAFRASGRDRINLGSPTRVPKLLKLEAINPVNPKPQTPGLQALNPKLLTSWPGLR